MNAFIEKNRGLLKTCCVAAKIYGWILLSLGSVTLIANFYALTTRIGDWAMFWYFFKTDVPWQNIHNITIGLLALGIGQFIRFVYDNNYQPNWVLRNAIRLLYIYTVVFGISLIT
ncbi:MAG: hypothetical protein ACYSUG_03920, partial [Planctomycetota bacterium]